MLKNYSGCRGLSDFIKIVLISLFLILISGCATYTVDKALIKNFKEPVVPKNKIGVYVIRSWKFNAGGRRIWVAANESALASLPNGSHVYLELDSGLNTLNFVFNTVGFGYIAVDNKPGQVIYAKTNFASEESFRGQTEILDKDLGQTMVMKTKAINPLTKKRNNSAYDNLLVNPGVLDYPFMVKTTNSLKVDDDHALVRFYRPGNSSEKIAFDIWNQNGYLGSTKGGTFFSTHLKPGRHVFISLSERYTVLEADLQAGKEYAVMLGVGWGFNQAHIKLLPINLSTDSGVEKITDWKEDLEERSLNKEVIERDIIAKRLDTGHKYLNKLRNDIASNKVSKRVLPSSFGLKSFLGENQK